MQLNTTHVQKRTIASLNFSGLSFGTRKAYLREETASERIWREEKLFKYCPKHCFRISIKFQDHSEKNFTIYSDDKETAIGYAPNVVQELVNDLGLERVVWRLEGGPYHITSAKVGLKLPSKSIIREWKSKINQSLERFFFVEDLD